MFDKLAYALLAPLVGMFWGFLFFFGSFVVACELKNIKAFAIGQGVLILGVIMGIVLFLAGVEDGVKAFLSIWTAK